MRVTLAYLGMIAIWSSIALGVKWSIEGPGYLFASAARFVVAALLVALIIFIRGDRIPLHAKAIQTYLWSCCNFLSFISLSWGAQYAPSGWMGVMYGALPLMTTLMAALWLGERNVSTVRLLGMLFGLSGLMVVFGTAFELGREAALGLAAILISVMFGAMNSVWVKRIGAEVSPLAVVGVGIVLATPVYVLVWWFADGVWPPSAPPLRAWIAIGYTAVFGTVIVFLLFYYVLKRVPVSRIALVGMVSPVISLILGNLLNGEPFTARIWVGTVMIVTALFLHEYLPARHAAGRRADATS